MLSIAFLTQSRRLVYQIVIDYKKKKWPFQKVITGGGKLFTISRSRVISLPLQFTDKGLFHGLRTSFRIFHSFHWSDVYHAHAGIINHPGAIQGLWIRIRGLRKLGPDFLLGQIRIHRSNSLTIIILKKVVKLF